MALDKLRRSIAIASLTRRYLFPKQIPSPCAYRLNGKPVVIEGPDALSLVLDIYWNDTYGLRRFPKLGTIVDIGANIGVFSLHASTRFPGSRIIACEPSEGVLPHLRKNTARSRVEVRPCAVGAESGTAWLQVDSNLTASHIVGEHGQAGLQSCAIVGFDELAANIGDPISLLKLDCEGSEYPILKCDAISGVRHIAAEFHTIPGWTPKAGLDLLASRDFEIVKWNETAGGRDGVVWASNKRLA